MSNTNCIKKRKDNTTEMTERYLKQAKKFDLGEDWLEELDLIL